MSFLKMATDNPKGFLNVRNATILGALLGIIGTRFLEDGNLLVTSVLVAISAVIFRVVTTALLKILTAVRA